MRVNRIKWAYWEINNNHQMKNLPLWNALGFWFQNYTLNRQEITKNNEIITNNSLYLFLSLTFYYVISPFLRSPSTFHFPLSHEHTLRICNELRRNKLMCVIEIISILLEKLLRCFFDNLLNSFYISSRWLQLFNWFLNRIDVAE